jgi:hypothetical protein
MGFWAGGREKGGFLSVFHVCFLGHESTLPRESDLLTLSNGRIDKGAVYEGET